MSSGEPSAPLAPRSLEARGKRGDQALLCAPEDGPAAERVGPARPADGHVQAVNVAVVAADPRLAVETMVTILLAEFHDGLAAYICCEMSWIRFVYYCANVVFDAILWWLDQLCNICT